MRVDQWSLSCLNISASFEPSSPTSASPSRSVASSFPPAAPLSKIEIIVNMLSIHPLVYIH